MEVSNYYSSEREFKEVKTTGMHIKSSDDDIKIKTFF